MPKNYTTTYLATFSLGKSFNYQGYKNPPGHLSLTDRAHCWTHTLFLGSKMMFAWIKNEPVVHLTLSRKAPT